MDMLSVRKILFILQLAYSAFDDVKKAMLVAVNLHLHDTVVVQ